MKCWVHLTVSENIKLGDTIALKASCKTARYERNPGGFVVHIKNITDQYTLKIHKEIGEIL